MGTCCSNLKNNYNNINMVRNYYLDENILMTIHKKQFRIVFKNYIKNYFKKFRNYNNIFNNISNNINKIKVYKAYFRLQSYAYCTYIYKLYNNHNKYLRNYDLHIIINNLFKNHITLINKIGIYYYNIILNKYSYTKKYKIMQNTSPYNLSFLYNMQDPDLELSLVHINRLIKYIKYWNTPIGYQEFISLILNKRRKL
tara:strand:+ start:904 stop:1497 length:594 start_codon:yes stop_codon:yes gene_type:complete